MGETREVKKVTLLAMSGDRGLCGSYNTYIIKKTEARKEELEAQGIEVEIVPVGTKMGGYFRRRGVEFPSEYNCPQVPTAEFAAAVSSEMLNKFLDGETDKVELIYTQFVSLIASAPKLKTLLPLSKTGLEAAEDEMFELTTEVRARRRDDAARRAGGGGVPQGHDLRAGPDRHPQR